MRSFATVAGAVLLACSCIGSVLGQEQSADAAKQLERILKSAPPPAASGAPAVPQLATPAASQVPNSVAAQEDSEYAAFKIAQEVTHRYLMILIVIAAVASLVIVLWFLRGIDPHDRGGTMVSATGLVLVVYGTILVVMLARADQQLTAAIGIMGAVAGYLFGSSATKTRAAAEPAAQGTAGAGSAAPPNP